MLEKTYRAWVVEEKDGQFVGAVRELATQSLPEGEVTVQVAYSSLNYKDALSASGNRGVTRNYPHTPGIDAAGVVLESTEDKIKPGSAVIVTGYDLGMNTAGGYGELIRVPASWVIPLPQGLSTRDAMRLGTAGLTAGLCVQALIERGGLKPKSGGEVLVTGATGGVGSISVALLAQLGLHVVAATRKQGEHTGWLKNLGASEVIDSSEWGINKPPPMGKPRWAGVVDTLGGAPLQHALAAVSPAGAAACCGMVAGLDVPLSIFPFILRGVSLLGIDSVEIPLSEKQAVLAKLAGDWNVSEALDRIVREVRLGELNHEVEKILAGKQVGRVLVAHESQGGNGG